MNILEALVSTINGFLNLKTSVTGGVTKEK